MAKYVQINKKKLGAFVNFTNVYNAYIKYNFTFSVVLKTGQCHLNAPEALIHLIHLRRNSNKFPTDVCSLQM